MIDLEFDMLSKFQTMGKKLDTRRFQPFWMLLPYNRRISLNTHTILIPKLKEKLISCATVIDIVSQVDVNTLTFVKSKMNKQIRLQSSYSSVFG